MMLLGVIISIYIQSLFYNWLARSSEKSNHFKEFANNISKTSALLDKVAVEVELTQELLRQ
jgi:hypothetical protein